MNWTPRHTPTVGTPLVIGWRNDDFDRQPVVSGRIGPLLLQFGLEGDLAAIFLDRADLERARLGSADGWSYEEAEGLHSVFAALERAYRLDDPTQELEELAAERPEFAAATIATILALPIELELWQRAAALAAAYPLREVPPEPAGVPTLLRDRPADSAGHVVWSWLPKSVWPIGHGFKSALCWSGETLHYDVDTADGPELLLAHEIGGDQDAVLMRRGPNSQGYVADSPRVRTDGSEWTVVADLTGEAPNRPDYADATASQERLLGLLSLLPPDPGDGQQHHLNL